ncbi:unnamed protein product [Brassica rapa]|uniref:Uncharacterized protein n=1 Tax=Brassica campestris TaxID=3711 RepID=A0A8D9H964_BRACM|nr:unnamed protein product [Brassica rapa]
MTRFNTGRFLTPPRQEQIISCIWYGRISFLHYLFGETAAEDRSKHKLISHNDSSGFDCFVLIRLFDR